MAGHVIEQDPLRRPRRTSHLRRSSAASRARVPQLLARSGEDAVGGFAGQRGHPRVGQQDEFDQEERLGHGAPDRALDVGPRLPRIDARTARSS